MQEELLRAYEAGPERITLAVGGVPEHVMQVSPGPDQWSINEILSHLADAEIVYSERIRRALGDTEARVQGFDESAWGDTLHYAARDPRTSLETVRWLRKANADLLRHCADADWAKTATHAERGPMSVRDLIQAGVDHADYHLAQIAAIKTANGIQAQGSH